MTFLLFPNLKTYFHGRENPDAVVSDLTHILCTSSFLVCGSTIAVLLLIYSSNAFAVALNITGGVTQSIVNFILPGLFAVAAFRQQKEKATNTVVLESFFDTDSFYFFSGFFLILVGLAILVLCIVSLFM